MHHVSGIEVFLQAVQENTRTCHWTGRVTTAASAVYEFDEKMNVEQVLGGEPVWEAEIEKIRQ